MTAPVAFTRSRYRWDERTGRYSDARGRFVSAATVRRELDTSLRSAQLRVRGLGEQLRTRSISLVAWERSMRRAMAEVHLYSAAAAKGGWAQVTQSDYGRVGRLLQDEYRFLAKFTREIRKGYPLDGRFLRRVELYAEAGRETYHHIEQREMESRGMDEERSVLAPSDHCDECVSEARKGWGPIGHTKQIGTRTCLRRCRCRKVYRRAA